MPMLARFFLITGIIFLVIGGLVYLFNRLNLNLPFGRLPGDFRIERENFSLSIPLGTSILLSIILTVILNLLVRWMRWR
jgi:hypothetical protein